MKLQGVLSITALSMLCPAAWCTATLTYSLNSQEIAILTPNAAPPFTCIKTTDGNEWPLACRLDSPGGHIVTNISGGFPAGGTFSGGTFSQTIQLAGNASVAIFPEPNAESKAALASYTFQIVIGPQISGDTFTLRLKQVNTCHNSSGACVTANLTVAGATTIKGKLENGQKITATQPVVITVTETISASSVVPNWSENISTTLEITPLKEVQTPEELNGLDDITSISGNGFHNGVV